MPSRTFHTADETATGSLGFRLGASASPGSAIALRGDLGAGKTVLARGIARGLGITGRVRSPTFVLVARHESGRHPLLHADLYRIAHTSEITGLDLLPALDEGAVVVVEWAERFPGALPPDHLELAVEIGEGDRRTITATAHGPVHARLLEALGD